MPAANKRLMPPSMGAPASPPGLAGVASRLAKGNTINAIVINSDLVVVFIPIMFRLMFAQRVILK